MVFLDLFQNKEMPFSEQEGGFGVKVAERTGPQHHHSVELVQADTGSGERVGYHT